MTQYKINTVQTLLHRTATLPNTNNDDDDDDETIFNQGHTK